MTQFLIAWGIGAPTFMLFAFAYTHYTMTGTYGRIVATLEAAHQREVGRNILLQRHLYRVWGVDDSSTPP